MKPEVYELEARWRARSEDAAACAARLAAMLEALAAIHPAFARWQNLGDTRGEANAPLCSMPPRAQELATTFEAGAFRGDFSGRPLPGGGYGVSAWNGLDGSLGLGFMIFAGAAAPNHRFPNSVTINFSECGAANADLISLAILKQVLIGVVGAWEPDWAGVSTMHDLPRLENLRGDIPDVRSGWITYLCPAYARRVLPPPGIAREGLRGGGLLLWSSAERYDTADPAHVGAADAIQSALAPLQRRI